jgi:hypothetical protein
MDESDNTPFERHRAMLSLQRDLMSRPYETILSVTLRSAIGHGAFASHLDIEQRERLLEEAREYHDFYLHKALQNDRRRRTYAIPAPFCEVNEPTTMREAMKEPQEPKSARETLEIRDRLGPEIRAIEALENGRSFAWPAELASPVVVTYSDQRFLVFDIWATCKPATVENAIQAALRAEALAREVSEANLIAVPVHGLSGDPQYKIVRNDQT